ncbi:hypothetical protein K2Z83_13750 [Oscillochloris sp. ZM17-4]|nr:hypothetical protein [Oscillochloris sp. ZM17-4]MBX0328741.1 hypothetical protein [Oscillochloris sp. ZM17-4]
MLNAKGAGQMERFVGYAACYTSSSFRNPHPLNIQHSAFNIQHSLCLSRC